MPIFPPMWRASKVNLNAEMVAREMHRARGPDGKLLFQASEFLAALQVASFFSRQNAAVRQHDPDNMDIQASEEEINFSRAKEAAETIQLQHTLVYDQYDLCAMAMEGTPKNLKLPMLQYSTCAKTWNLIYLSHPYAKKLPTWRFWSKLQTNARARSNSEELSVLLPCSTIIF